MTRILVEHAYHAIAYSGLADLAAALDDQVGVVMLTEEALATGSHLLLNVTQDQPVWSDIPFILLAAKRSLRSRSTEAARTRLWDLLSNAIILERPLSLKSLLSALDSAMRSRQKQFQMRDRLADLDRARHAQSESEARLRLATEAAEIGFWDVNTISGKMFWPTRVKAMFGISPDVEVSMADFYAGLHPDDAGATANAYAAASDPEKRAVYDVEYRTVGKEDGQIRWVAAKGRGIFEDQRCIRVIGTAIDITARKSAELGLISLNETLEERVTERTARLMETEAALRQSQKMEAVGQLTGGIAHDFNNMLTGVIGSLDIMRRRIAAGRVNELERYMDAASKSAQRAATLTARLLAFSRRQSLDARPLDTGKLILSLDELLRRTIRETISLHIVPESNLPLAIADANQLENAILNLAINSRDAMPNGGELTVATKMVDVREADANRPAGLEAGRYVAIVVSDTGVGMSPEVLEKAFDPFFTTKPVGQGTGLGLSMVYGFARQSGGHVRIDSKPGHGTAVSIYLRAADQSQIEEPDVSADVSMDGDGRHVLVIEDDPSVRILIRDVLEDLRHTVIEVGEAGSAVPILQSERQIDLMVSDVGLPDMNGRQLAEIARQHRPELPILFVTGYAENAAIRAGFLGTNMAMITKPFAVEALGSKISQMLRKA